MAYRSTFFLPKRCGQSDTCWQPAVDVYRRQEGWVVKCELAGVNPRHIQTSVSGCRLIISGCRRDLSVKESQQAYSMEIRYDRFERTVEMPCDLRDADFEVDYRDGMLIITVHV